MSTAVLEQVVAAHDGGDLASLVIAYHREHHAREPGQCGERMCRVAAQVVDLDVLFYGADG